MKKNTLITLSAVIWLLLITVLLCIPGTGLPKFKWDTKIFLDKWIHVFLFMVLVILWSKTYSYKKNTKANNRKIFFQIMILAFLYSIMMELVQKYFVPNRSFDLVDVAANGIGCIGGYFFSLKKFLSQ